MNIDINKEKQFKAYWESKRKNGRLWYSFRHGVLIFAWPVYLITEIIKYLTRKSDYVFLFDLFLKGLLIWTILGFIAFGTIMWWTNEKRYRLLQKKEDY